jgi:hypothetical protein
MSASIIKMRPAAAPGKLGCSACGATTEAACDCGAPYLPAGQRAAEAIAANPEKSDRAIAVEIGVDHKTVGKARRSVGDHSPPDKRVGQDGKSYPAKVAKPTADDERPASGTAGWKADKLRSAQRFLTAIDEKIARDAAKVAKPVPVDDEPGDDLDDEPGDTPEMIAERGFIYRVTESASMAHYPLGKLIVDDGIVAAARDAAESWSQLLAKLTADLAEAKSRSRRAAP